MDSSRSFKVAWIFAALFGLSSIGLGVVFYLEFQKTGQLVIEKDALKQEKSVLEDEIINLSQQIDSSSSQIVSLGKVLAELQSELDSYRTKEAKQKEAIQAELAQGQITVSSPKAGDRFCTGADMTINWKAPADMQTVTTYLIPSGLDGYAIGSHPASSNELGKQDGTGAVVWKVPDYRIGEAYTLRVNGVYKSRWIVSNAAGPFAIEKCTG